MEMCLPFKQHCSHIKLISIFTSHIKCMSQGQHARKQYGRERDRQDSTCYSPRQFTASSKCLTHCAIVLDNWMVKLAATKTCATGQPLLPREITFIHTQVSGYSMDKNTSFHQLEWVWVKHCTCIHRKLVLVMENSKNLNSTSRWL